MQVIPTAGGRPRTNQVLQRNVSCSAGQTDITKAREQIQQLLTYFRSRTLVPTVSCSTGQISQRGEENSCSNHFQIVGLEFLFP